MQHAQHRAPPPGGTNPRTAGALAAAAGSVGVLVLAAPALGGSDGVLSSRLAVAALLLVALALALAAAASWRSPAPRGLVVAAVLAALLAAVGVVVVIVPAVVSLVVGP